MYKRLVNVALICLAASVPAIAQDVYRGTDEDGTPTFSDIPQQDSKKLDLKPLSVIPATTPIKLNFKSPKAKVKYNSLEITAPADDSTIFINSSNLSINVSVVPPVRGHLGHILQILLDGSVIAENQTAFTLAEVDRGSHRVSAQIIDDKDRTVIKSKPVTVHIKKPNI